MSLLGLIALLAACSESDEPRDPNSLGGSGLRTPLDAEIDDPPSSLDASAPAADTGAPPPSDAGAPPPSDAEAPPPSDAGVLVDAALPVSCPVDAPRSCPDPAAIRYADVAPIIEARCASCHSPLWSGPWPLNTLSHVRDWTEDIRSNLLACTMPPLDAGIPMTKEERLTILQWIRCGTPE